METYIVICVPRRYPFSLFPSSLRVGSEGKTILVLWERETIFLLRLLQMNEVTNGANSVK